MKNTLKKAKDKLKKFKGFEVSPELNRKLQKLLSIDSAPQAPARAQEKVTVQKKSGFFFFLKTYVLPVALAFAIFAGFILFNQNSYTFYLNRVKTAQTDILELIKSGKGSDELTEAINGMIRDTAKSMETAGKINDTAKLSAALKEINSVQVDSERIFVAAIKDPKNDEKLLDTANKASGITIRLLNMMYKAIDFVDSEAKKGEKEVFIDLAVDDISGIQ